MDDRGGTAPAVNGRESHGDRSEARRRSRPARVGTIVDELLDRFGIRERVEKAKTAERWDEIVGPHIARVTRAKRVRGGTLFVEVAGAAWMTELNMMRPRLLRQLNEDRERGRIETIRFVQAENAETDASGGRDRNRRGRG